MAYKALLRVFSIPSYVVTAVTVAVAVFSLSVWLPNWRLIFIVFTSTSVSFTEALNIVFGLFLSIKTNFTVVSASYTVAIAVLFGANVSLLRYYMYKRRSFQKRGGVFSIGGLISGIFGIGCSACGTFILTSVLALIGAGGIISFLPFGGEEFGILGVVLIGYATYWTAVKIEEPAVC